MFLQKSVTCWLHLMYLLLRLRKSCWKNITSLSMSVLSSAAWWNSWVRDRSWPWWGTEIWEAKYQIIKFPEVRCSSLRDNRNPRAQVVFQTRPEMFVKPSNIGQVGLLSCKNFSSSIYRGPKCSLLDDFDLSSEVFRAASKQPELKTVLEFFTTKYLVHILLRLRCVFLRR